MPAVLVTVSIVTLNSPFLPRRRPKPSPIFVAPDPRTDDQVEWAWVAWSPDPVLTELNISLTLLMWPTPLPPFRVNYCNPLLRRVPDFLVQRLSLQTAECCCAPRFLDQDGETTSFQLCRIPVSQPVESKISRLIRRSLFDQALKKFGSSHGRLRSTPTDMRRSPHTQQKFCCFHWLCKHAIFATKTLNCCWLSLCITQHRNALIN